MYSTDWAQRECIGMSFSTSPTEVRRRTSLICVNRAHAEGVCHQLCCQKQFLTKATLQGSSVSRKSSKTKNKMLGYTELSWIRFNVFEYVPTIRSVYGHIGSCRVKGSSLVTNFSPLWRKMGRNCTSKYCPWSHFRYNCRSQKRNEQTLI